MDWTNVRMIVIILQNVTSFLSQIVTDNGAHTHPPELVHSATSGPDTIFVRSRQDIQRGR